MSLDWKALWCFRILWFPKTHKDQASHSMSFGLRWYALDWFLQPYFIFSVISQGGYHSYWSMLGKLFIRGHTLIGVQIALGQPRSVWHLCTSQASVRCPVRQWGAWDTAVSPCFLMELIILVQCSNVLTQTYCPLWLPLQPEWLAWFRPARDRLLPPGSFFAFLGTCSLCLVVLTMRAVHWGRTGNGDARLLDALSGFTGPDQLPCEFLVTWEK